MVPNLTTSGLYGDAELERLCGWAPLFGQINVSIDGVGEDYAAVRGFDGFARADRAVVALRKASKHVGINCVVTRDNFDGLGARLRVRQVAQAARGRAACASSRRGAASRPTRSCAAPTRSTARSCRRS